MDSPKLAPPPWSLPPQSLSPKNLSASDRERAAREVAAFDAALPVTRAATPPASWYLSESFARAELGGVFGRTWQLACRAEQVAAIGAYVTTFIGLEPVIVVRGEDGELRAFSNVCRHHAARIADGEGSARELVCPYHAWAYNLEGRLIRANRLKTIQDFNAATTRLPALRVEVWGPLVFVNLSPAAGANANTDASANADTGANTSANADANAGANTNAEARSAYRRPVGEQLAETAAQMEATTGWESGPAPWRALGHLRRRVYEIGSNWKVYADNYLDGGYHIPHIHKGLNEELDMSLYRTDLYESVSIQSCPAKSARVGSAAVYAYLFPNLAINKYGDWLDTNLVLPITQDRCVVVFDWYHLDAATRRDELRRELDASLAIQNEDIAISESVQSGLASAGYDTGRYAPSVEQAAHHFHRLVSAAMTSYLRE